MHLCESTCQENVKHGEIALREAVDAEVATWVLIGTDVWFVLVQL